MVQQLHVLFAGSAGLLSHWSFFIHGEHHLPAAMIFRTYLGLLFILFALYFGISRVSIRDALLATLFASVSYALALFSSMIVYRLVFHQLRQFPGPILAKISKLYHMWNIRSYDQYLFLDKLHRRYGDFVRTGPNEITIFSPMAIAGVLGPDTKCSKSAWYDMMWPEVSMVTTRSKAEHDARRRAWDMGFSMKALRDYEPCVYSNAGRLEAIVSTLEGKPINVTELFEYYTFDVMGAVNFGVQFDCLKKRRFIETASLFKEGTKVLGPFTPVPWLFRITASVPGLQKNWLAFRSWADRRLRARLDQKPEKPDSVSWVIDHASKEGGAEARYRRLLGDFITLTTAASDPVLYTLVFLFFHLATAPTQVEKLRRELDGLDDLSNDRLLKKLRHFNGLINETLRLHPPVPSGGLRNTPQEGLTVGSTYIPGNTTVLVPHYSLGRREDCYEDADAFVPERWYSRMEMVKNKAAFIPFSCGTTESQEKFMGLFADGGTGNYKCVGQNLALMEIRIATAALIWKYDVALAPGETGLDVVKGTKDLFVASPGPLQIVFQQK